MECGWYAYQSKSGETLFFFNKITGQYKWLSCSCSKNLEPWVTVDANACSAITSEVIEHDNRTNVPVRSIATETDLPAAQKMLVTQGTQTEWLDGISCTDDTVAKNVLSRIILKNSNHEKIFIEENTKPLLSRNNSLVHETKSNNYMCRGKEKSKLPSCSMEPRQTSKVKLFDCSYCEKAFTSYAFLVKHEKYHVENNSQKVCNDLDEIRSEDSISSTVPEVENVVSTLINISPSSEVDSTPFSQTCFQCGKNFISPDEFDIHLEVHLKELFCNPCQRPYRNVKQFLKHLCSKHITQRHNCHLCKCKFLFKSSVAEHLRHFHKVGKKEEATRVSYSYKCGSCAASFKMSDKLMEHQEMTKHEGTEYQCNGCENLYTVLDNAQQHLIQEHNLDTQSTTSSLSNSSSKRPKQHEESLANKTACLDSVLLDEKEKATTRYHCHKCDVSYMWHSDLTKHKMKKKCCVNEPIVQDNGDSQKYICRYCDRVFDNKKKFGKHYVRHFLKKVLPISCDQCTRRFSTFEALEKHFVAHLGKQIKKENEANEANDKVCLKPYSCEVCGKSFGSKRNVRRHIKRNHTKKNPDTTNKKERFSCDICNKVFYHRTALISHKKTHLLQKISLKKEGTNQETETSTNKASELQTEEGIPAEKNAKGYSALRKYKCSKCQKTFFNSECLNRHKKLLDHGEVLHLRSSLIPTMEEPKKKPGTIYHCQVCKKSFKYYNVFYKHRSAHKGEKVRACKICRKVFKASVLSSDKCLSCKKAPQKTIKDFNTCKLCGKNFLESRSLKDHMQSHAQGRFDCKSCNVAFSSEERLVKHMKNHKVEINKLKNFKPYKAKLHECNKCERIYAGRKNLVRHRKICMKKVNNRQGISLVNNESKKDRVQKENRKKSEKKSQKHSCQKCQKSFSLFSEFCIHCSEHHGEEKPCCKCNKFLSCSRSLKRHLLEIHTREHNFYCHMCPEKFYDLNGLINHLTFVQGEKRHKCKQCGQGFALCSRLMEHVKVHT